MNKGLIQRKTMTARYIDDTGEHELDAKDIVLSPFMVPRSGVHKVIITNK